MPLINQDWEDVNIIDNYKLQDGLGYQPQELSGYEHKLVRRKLEKPKIEIEGNIFEFVEDDTRTPWRSYSVGEIVYLPFQKL